MAKTPVAPLSRLKMADIARLADVSVSTVSRALSGSSLVPQALREKIEALAAENGYAVNHAARNLRLQTTRTIGIVLPMGHETLQEITDPFLLEMIGHLSQAVIARGYDILLTKVAAPAEGWLNTLIQSHRFDGMLMLGQSDQHAVIDEVAPRYLPMVVWGEKLKSQTYCSVGVDNVYAGRLATEHLLGLGRRHIRFLGPANVPEVDSRYQGYCEAMAAAGKHGPVDLIDTHFTFESAVAAVEGLLRSRSRIDGIFAASDVIAHGAMAALAGAGLSVPGDVAVCGFDDVAMAKSLSPPLTTIRQDLVMASHIMVDLLFKRIAGELTSSAVIPASLIVRGSTLGQPAA